MNKVDSSFKNFIDIENQIKEEKNFEAFNTLDDNSKDLVRALYFLDTDNILLDGENYKEKTMEDIKNKFVKAKRDNNLSLGSKLNDLTDNDKNILLRLITLVFPNLENLDLGHNQLTTLPELNLPNLKALILTNNQLTTLPKLNSPNLKYLYLKNNKISQEEIEELKSKFPKANIN